MNFGPGLRIGLLEVAGADQVGVKIESDPLEIGRAVVSGLRGPGAVPVLLARGAGRSVRIAETRFAPGQALRDLRRPQ